MHLRVEHTTEFTYDGPIAEAYTELRLRPLEGGGQHCSSFRLSTEPSGLRVREYRDHFGNDVHHFDVLEPHERLAVTAISEVMTPPALRDGPRGALAARAPRLPAARPPTRPSPTAWRLRRRARRRRRRPRAAGARASWRPCARAPRLRPRGDRRADPRRRGARARPRRLPGLRPRHARRLPLGRASRRATSAATSTTRSCVGDNAASHAWVDVWDEATGWIVARPDARPRSRPSATCASPWAATTPTCRRRAGSYKGVAQETLSVRVGLARAVIA